MGMRNWLVEDNIVALYIALYKCKDMKYELKEIRKIIPHKGFSMRIQQFIAIKTKGKHGLKAGLNSPLFREIYRIFRRLKQKDFAKLVNLILIVKSKINKVYLRCTKKENVDTRIRKAIEKEVKILNPNG